jgi:hypothetical protein
MHKPKFIIGFTTNHFLLLDFDETTLNKVEGISRIILEQYNLGSYIIMLSSEQKSKVIFKVNENSAYYIPKTIDGSYHVIFGKAIPYTEICNIIVTLSELDIMNKSYANIRNWRGDVTLRISPDYSEGAFRPIPKLLRVNISRILHKYDFIGLLEYSICYDSVNNTKMHKELLSYIKVKFDNRTGLYGWSQCQKINLINTY